MTVWKFPLALTEEQMVEMPVSHRSLCIQMQDSQPCLWALVDPLSKRGRTKILTVGTGHPFVADREVMDYIGTYQQPGPFVWHVFYVGWEP